MSKLCILAKQILVSKYGSWRGLDDNEDSNYKSWWSRDIRKIWRGDGKDNWFDKNIGYTRKKE